MDRRKAVKNLIIATGTVITLPAWMQSCGISDGDSHTTDFTKKDQDILASVADTIIPAGNSIGALSVGTDKYLIKIIDDCYGPEVKANVQQQFKKLDELSKKQYSRDFREGNQQERESVLLVFSDSKVKQEKDFFDLLKSETIKGFATSKEVMVDHLGYQIAPGHYYGCLNADT